MKLVLRPVFRDDARPKVRWVMDERGVRQPVIAASYKQDRSIP